MLIEAKPVRSLPLSLALDSANNRVLLVDSGLDAVVTIDLTTISNTSTP